MLVTEEFFFCVMEFCDLMEFVRVRVLVFVIMYVYLALVDVECCMNQIISTLTIFLQIYGSYQYRSNNSAIYCR